MSLLPKVPDVSPGLREAARLLEVLSVQLPALAGAERALRPMAANVEAAAAALRPALSRGATAQGQSRAVEEALRALRPAVALLKAGHGGPSRQTALVLEALARVEALLALLPDPLQQVPSPASPARACRR